MARLVDDERLRRVVELAVARGIPQTRIARIAGISRDIVREIVTGKPHHRRKRPSEISEHNYSTYINHGCRCRECRDAAHAYHQAWYQDHKRCPTSPVPHDPVFFDRIGAQWKDPTGDEAAFNIDTKE